MKRILSVLLVLLMLPALAGCLDAQEPVTGEPAELIAQGKVKEAYEILLARDDEASKAELEKFIFVPAKTQDVDYSNSDSSRIYTVEYTWDEKGRPDKVIADMPAYNQHTEITYVYNDNGYTQMRDGEVDEEVTLDAEGKLLKHVVYYAEDNIRTMVYTYDDKGQLVKIVTDKSGEPYETEEFFYDEKGNLIKETSAVVGNDGMSVYEYTYDSQGRLVNEIQGSAHVAYTYDDKGNLVQEVTTYPGSLEKYTGTYTYNDRGQVLTYVQDAVDNYGVEKRSYQREITYNDMGLPATKVELSSKDFKETYEWTYDEYGNLTKEVKTSGYPNEEARVDTLEHTGYQVFYVPVVTEQLAEILESYQPDID